MKIIFYSVAKKNILELVLVRVSKCYLKTEIYIKKNTILLKYITFMIFKRTKRNANCIRHLLNPFENRQETSMAKPPLFRRLSVVLKAIGTPRMP